MAAIGPNKGPTDPRRPAGYHRRHLGRLRAWQDRLRDPCLTLLLVVQMVLIFLGLPMAATGLPIPPVILLLAVLTTMSLVVLVSRSRGALLVGPIAFVAGIVGAVARSRDPTVELAIISAVGTVGAFVAVNWVIAAAVFAGGRVTFHRVQGAIVLYLNIALTFTALYRLVAELDPTGFAGMPAVASGPAFESSVVYFSLTTLTSTGFGDIVPLHPFGRSLANLESMIGQLYPATLLARIVTLEIAGRTR